MVLSLQKNQDNDRDFFISHPYRTYSATPIIHGPEQLCVVAPGSDDISILMMKTRGSGVRGQPGLSCDSE